MYPVLSWGLCGRSGFTYNAVIIFLPLATCRWLKVWKAGYPHPEAPVPRIFRDIETILSSSVFMCWRGCVRLRTQIRSQDWEELRPRTHGPSQENLIGCLSNPASDLREPPRGHNWVEFYSLMLRAPARRTLTIRLNNKSILHCLPTSWMFLAGEQVNNNADEGGMWADCHYSIPKICPWNSMDLVRIFFSYWILILSVLVWNVCSWLCFTRRRVTENGNYLVCIKNNFIVDKTDYHFLLIGMM